jgi:dihydropteroate synthase
MSLAPTQSVPAQRAIRCPTGRTIEIGDRPLVMGVLNLTPDSFSDGGQWSDPDKAVEHALELESQGADLLDLGAESTRPGGGTYADGAVAVSATDELDRLLPVLRRVRALVAIPISVDTRKGVVAERALDEGADLINDISALEDPYLAEVVADRSAPIVLMHSRGPLASMQRRISFDDVVGEVASELRQKVEDATHAGISQDRIIIDPGIGFGKTKQQNLELLRNLDRLGELGYPILVGASRKSFIGEIGGSAPDHRLSGSLAAIGWAQHFGAFIVRVHDVKETVQFIRVWNSIATAKRVEP